MSDTVTVRYTDSKNFYYVKDGLCSLKVGWMSVKKHDKDADLTKEKDHPLINGVLFDDEYIRVIYPFNFWKMSAKNNNEEELPMGDPMVKDYIDRALESGWKPKESKHLRDDQNKNIRELNRKIQRSYGYKPLKEEDK